MIFKQEYVDMILAGTKTQTRRPNRGYYKVGKTYAIQPCRTCKGISGYRIMIDSIWEEVHTVWFRENISKDPSTAKLMPIKEKDANEEGFWSSFSFELAFRELYPKWDGRIRWALEFHVVVPVVYGPNSVIWEER